MINFSKRQVVDFYNGYKKVYDVFKGLDSTSSEYVEHFLDIMMTFPEEQFILGCIDYYSYKDLAHLKYAISDRLEESKKTGYESDVQKYEEQLAYARFIEALEARK